MRPAPILAALLLLSAGLSVAAPTQAQAQTYSSYGSYRTYEYGYGHEDRAWRRDAHRRYDFNGQADRPGDYRCDRYWDAGRSDCGAAWRDQRPVRDRAWSDRRWAPDYGHGRPGVYPGAYGRPDLIYPGGGVGYGQDYGRGYGYGAARDPIASPGAAPPIAPMTRSAATTAPTTGDWSSAAEPQNRLRTDEAHEVAIPVTGIAIFWPRPAPTYPPLSPKIRGGS